MSDADIRAAESKRAMESSYAETFAEAFLDPNIMIGIFEPVEYSLSAMKSLGEEWMEHLDEYFTVSNKRFLIVLKPEKVIRGVLEVPLVFCCPVHPAFVLDRNGGKSTPGFMPFSGRRWILALEKTTRQKRIALYGVVVADCSFINDRTFFKEHNSGYGVLCLEPVGEPDRNTRVVPEDAIVDLENIQKIASVVGKETRDPNETAAIAAVRTVLKTDIAKSIFDAMLLPRPPKPEDPNNVSN